MLNSNRRIGVLPISCYFSHYWFTGKKCREAQML